MFLRSSQRSAVAAFSLSSPEHGKNVAREIAELARFAAKKQRGEL